MFTVLIKCYKISIYSSYWTCNISYSSLCGISRCITKNLNNIVFCCI